MTIPIRNLYYLFLYAWDLFPGGPLSSTGIDESKDLPNLFARLLSVGTSRLLRRGLDRGYQIFTEEMVMPRGRLRLDRMVKETTLLRGTAVCDFAELSHDVPHNQILKASLASLGRCNDVQRQTRHDLLSLARRLNDVSNIRLSQDCFRRVSISRNSRGYIFLLRLCEFVFWSLMPDERGASSRFQEVLDDEVRMSAVFEEFLRNFFHAHRPEYRVRGESTKWDVSEATFDDCALLPRMITDVTLRHQTHTIIVDAKFYRRTLDHGRFGERIRSSHLYQLVTYLQHERKHSPDVPLAGMLLYPEAGRSLRMKYRLLGAPVLVATINLEQEWRDIERDLHDLLDDCAAASRSTHSLVAEAAA